MTLRAADLLVKARRALASARLLLESGDADGACNRAYYAMFDAARAVLIALKEPLPRTHSGLIASFGLAVVAKDHLPKSLGMALNRVQRIREIADYTGDGVAPNDARAAVAAAEAFVSAASGLIEGRHRD